MVFDSSFMLYGFWMKWMTPMSRTSWILVLAAYPDDVDALYQLAAAYTQLGNLAQARELLSRWMTAMRMPAPLVAERLASDGRFALLRTYDSGGLPGLP